jgi:hypothetical protein
VTRTFKLNLTSDKEKLKKPAENLQASMLILMGSQETTTTVENGKMLTPERFQETLMKVMELQSTLLPERLWRNTLQKVWPLKDFQTINSSFLRIKLEKLLSKLLRHTLVWKEKRMLNSLRIVSTQPGITTM